jgi:glycine cleavage system transcriptional repressor
MSKTKPDNPTNNPAAGVAPVAVLIAYGPDRPGILDEVSQYLFERGANIADSKLLSMRGTFILMILIAADRAALGKIRSDLKSLASGSRIGIDLRDAQEDAHDVVLAYRFTASGSDQAGVLFKLSHLLRALGINIADVHTHVDTSEDTPRDLRLFKLELLLSIPNTVPIIKLREYLQTLCGELRIQWELTPA